MPGAHISFTGNNLFLSSGPASFLNCLLFSHIKRVHEGTQLRKMYA